MDQVDIKQDDATETQEYLDQMAEKGRNLDQSGESTTDQKKDDTQVDDASANTDKSTDDSTTDSNKDSDNTNDLTIDQARDKADEAGVNFDAAVEEYMSKGELSDETYADMEKKGLSKEIVNRFIEGEKLKAESKFNTLMEDVGGQEKYQEVVQWASENLSPEQIAAYNKAVSSESDMDSAQFAVKGLAALYSQANPSGPNLLNDTSKASNAGTSFASWSEVTAAMKDPRYKTDSAYVKEVERKISNSNLASRG